MLMPYDKIVLILFSVPLNNFYFKNNILKLDNFKKQPITIDFIIEIFR